MAFTLNGIYCFSLHFDKKKDEERFYECNAMFGCYSIDLLREFAFLKMYFLSFFPLFLFHLFSISLIFPFRFLQLLFVCYFVQCCVVVAAVFSISKYQAKIIHYFSVCVSLTVILFAQKMLMAMN